MRDGEAARKYSSLEGEKRREDGRVLRARLDEDRDINMGCSGNDRPREGDVRGRTHSRRYTYSNECKIHRYVKRDEERKYRDARIHADGGGASS